MLRLLQLDQGAIEILGMQEQHRLVMGPDLRLAVAQHARPPGLQAVGCRVDVIDLVADMVDAAARVPLQESLDRRGIAQRLQQLDLGVWKFDEHDRDAVRRLRDWRGNLRTESAAVSGGGGRQVRYRNGYVVKSPDHRSSCGPQCCSAAGRAQAPVSCLS